MGIIRDITDLATQPHKARKSNEDVNAVRLARETKHLKLSGTFEKLSEFDKKIQLARLRVLELKRKVEKRKKHLTSDGYMLK